MNLRRFEHCVLVKSRDVRKLMTLCEYRIYRMSHTIVYYSLIVNRADLIIGGLLLLSVAYFLVQ